MEAAFETLLGADRDPAVAGAFLMGLAQRGESATEIAAAARILRNYAKAVQAPQGAVDCCGTGGDARGTYNISTAVALVCAACGVPVAKHGNRAASSKSGAADVLEALGVSLNASQKTHEQALQDLNFTFLMAPHHYDILRPLAPIRAALGFRTLFNILGPLANPAGTKRQLIGVFKPDLCPLMANALKELGSERAWIVHGRDGLDEITLTTSTDVTALEPDGTIKDFTLTPDDFGLPSCNADDLKGGSAEENATALERLLQGAKSAYRDVVLANSAAVLKISDQVKTLKEGVQNATTAIDAGKAHDTLTHYIDLTNQNK